MARAVYGRPASRRSGRQQYRSDRLRGDALAAAGETQPLGRGRLHRDPPWLHPQQAGETGDHRRGVRGDLRALADQGDVGIGEQAAARGDKLGGVGEEAGAVSILPGRLGRREVPADVAFGERTVDRITQRVDADIGIGVPSEAALVGDFNAAEDQGRPAFSTWTSNPVPTRGTRRSDMARSRRIRSSL